MGRMDLLWRECKTRLSLPEETVVWQNPVFQFRRVYASDGLVCKIVDIGKDASASRRKQDPEGEFRILRHCAGVPGIPAALSCVRTDQFTAVVMTRLPGQPLSDISVGWLQLLAILAKLGVILVRLAWRGVSHSDIRCENVLVTRDNRVSIIDFDQAFETTVCSALLSHFFGVSLGGSRVYGSIVSVVKGHLKRTLPTRATEMLRGLQRRYNRKLWMDGR